MSVKVPEKLIDRHKHEFAVHSKSFVHTLLSANRLDTAKNYPIRGICSQLENAIVFKLKTDVEGLGKENAPRCRWCA